MIHDLRCEYLKQQKLICWQVQRGGAAQSLGIGTCTRVLPVLIAQQSKTQIQIQTRSSKLNCALRDDEACYWVIVGHYEAVAVGNW